MTRISLYGLVLGLVLGAASVQAKEAAPLAEDPAVEAQVMAISKELRCLVCQNQTIADSSAPLAVDLRREVRAMVQQGMGQQEVVQFMEQRYGDFVRYRPPFKATTLVLWLGPFLLFVIALTVLYTNVLRKRRTINDTQPLNDEEKARLTSLLDRSETAGDTKT